MIVILMALFLWFSIAVHADAGPSPGNENPQVTEDQNNGENNDKETNADSGIEIEPEEKSWFTKALEKTNGEAWEDTLNATSALINQWVFSTPKLIHYQWIVNIWWLTYLPALILLCIGGGWSLIKVLMGSQYHKWLFRAFIIGFIGCSISLFLSDQIIQYTNMAFSSIAKSTLEKKYAEVDQEFLVEGTKTNGEVNFNSFTGIALVKMAFGADLTKKEPFYKTFTENGGGGLYVMFWAMGLLTTTGIFSILRYGVVGLLGGLASLWFIGCAYTGDIKPGLGYINLFVRSTVGFTLIMDLAWLFAVKAGASEEFTGIGQQIIACILFSVAILAVIWLWLRWVIKAAWHPISLAGDQVQEDWEKRFKKINGGIETTRGRMGSRERGSNRADSDYRDGAESISNGGYDMPTEALQTTTTYKSKIETLLEEVTQEPIRSTTISKGEAYGQDKVAEKDLIKYSFRDQKDYENVEGQIREKLPYAFVEAIDEGGKRSFMIDEQYNHQVGEIIKDYEEKPKYWETENGGFYYFHEELKRIVKDKNPPDNGVHMGTLAV
jgi:hypothetical protein